MHDGNIAQTARQHSPGGTIVSQSDNLRVTYEGLFKNSRQNGFLASFLAGMIRVLFFQKQTAFYKTMRYKRLSLQATTI